ncbi:MAG: cyclophilin-like fold protein [Candidatus Omnitrophica bacterium]|nr:cyclophilin-like fold protein [Candidatus Omnitrophota bacterium]MCM8829325.1 cyclophilin-like fold protein [Candidatus Omnitrophota bacterium]
MKKIFFRIGSEKIQGNLNENKTASAIYSALPFRGRVNLWGKEIYFYVDIRLPLENGQDTVNVGDIAYWPEGPAICIFFGPTPASKENEIRPYSKVNLIGRIDGLFVKNLYNVKSGEEIIMKPITNGGD